MLLEEFLFRHYFTTIRDAMKVSPQHRFDACAILQKIYFSYIWSRWFTILLLFAELFRRFQFCQPISPLSFEMQPCRYIRRYRYSIFSGRRHISPRFHAEITAEAHVWVDWVEIFTADFIIACRDEVFVTPMCISAAIRLSLTMLLIVLLFRWYFVSHAFNIVRLTIRRPHWSSPPPFYFQNTQRRSPCKQKIFDIYTQNDEGTGHSYHFIFMLSLPLRCRSLLLAWLSFSLSKPLILLECQIIRVW